MTKQETHTANMLALLRDILSDKSVDEISYEDKHFIFIAKRNTAKESTFAIGFNADNRRQHRSRRRRRIKGGVK